MGDLLDGQVATALGGKSTEELNLLARLAKKRQNLRNLLFESLVGVIADIDRKIEEHTVHGWKTHPAWDENGNESFMDVPASEMLPEAEALAIASQPLRELRDLIARIHDLRAASLQSPHLAETSVTAPVKFYRTGSSSQAPAYAPRPAGPGGLTVRHSGAPQHEGILT